MLGGIQCQNQNIFVIVETTCPLLKSDRPSSSDNTRTLRRMPETILDMIDEDEEDTEEYYEQRNFEVKPRDLRSYPRGL